MTFSRGRQIGVDYNSSLFGLLWSTEIQFGSFFIYIIQNTTSFDQVPIILIYYTFKMLFYVSKLFFFPPETQKSRSNFVTKIYTYS